MDAIQPGEIILLAGYRRMGKDTFYKAMENGDVSHYEITPKFPDFDPNNVHRIAFGDILKIRVAEILDMGLQELENKKDSPLDRDYKFAIYAVDQKATKTFRDVMIDQALVIKRLDPSYFVRYAMTNFYDEKSINVVTDLRFFVELNYIKEHFSGKYRVARIFREGVPIPPLDDVYEHELDGVVADWEIRSI